MYPASFPMRSLLLLRKKWPSMWVGFEETPYQGVDEGPTYKIGGYMSQENPRAAFVAMVELLDKQVGEITG